MDGGEEGEKGDGKEEEKWEEEGREERRGEESRVLPKLGSWLRGEDVEKREYCRLLRCAGILFDCFSFLNSFKGNC